MILDKQFFQKYQKPILWLANSFIGEFVFKFKQIGNELRKEEKIDKITPNSIRYKNKDNSYTEQFFGRNEYALRLAPLVWWLPIELKSGEFESILRPVYQLALIALFIKFPRGLPLLGLTTNTQINIGDTWKDASEMKINIPVEGAVGHWKMNDNLATTVVIDSSGNGNNGVAQENTDQLDVAGKINNALTFDGSGDHIDCGHDASLWSAGDTTYSAWIYPTAFDSYTMIMGQGTSNWHKFFWVGSTGSIRAYWAHSDTAAVSQSSTLVGLDEWSLVTAVFNDDTWDLYINGKEVEYSSHQAGIGTPNDYSANNFAIGAVDGGSLGFTGRIDDVRNYDRALAQDEILRIYNSGSGTEDGITASWKDVF